MWSWLGTFYLFEFPLEWPPVSRVEVVGLDGGFYVKCGSVYLFAPLVGECGFRVDCSVMQIIPYVGGNLVGPVGGVSFHCRLGDVGLDDWVVEGRRVLNRGVAREAMLCVIRERLGAWGG